MRQRAPSVVTPAQAGVQVFLSGQSPGVTEQLGSVFVVEEQFHTIRPMSQYFLGVFMLYKLKILLLLFLCIFLYANQNITHGKFLKFAVISDPHYYSPSLGVAGDDFIDAIFDEIKLFQYGKNLFEEAIKGIVAENVDFLIIPGDLTKDGELQSHIELAGYLDMLSDYGIPSYVIPGNHDINNPYSFSYSIEGLAPVATINKNDFRTIYHKFGYETAIFSHNDSLSYVAEPINGVWLLAIDSCKYEDIDQFDRIGGHIKESLLRWVVFILIKARMEGIKVIAFMHHPLLENFKYQSTLTQNQIIKNNYYVSSVFSSYGLNLIFTGHTHTQNSTVIYFENEKYILDIQTGSILTYPHPYRIVTIFDNVLDIKTNYISEIYDNGSSVDFTNYSKNLSRESVLSKVNILPDSFFPLCVDKNFYIETYFAHTKGDENPSQYASEIIHCLLSSKNLFSVTLGLIFQSIWTDLPPEDNNFQFILR